MTQHDLAEAAGVNVSYISNLERDFSANTRSGRPRPSEQLCERFATVLKIPLDDVRLAAGYAAVEGKPKTLNELLRRLEDLGVENLHFKNDLRNATPDELQQVLDAVRVAVEVTLSRNISHTFDELHNSVSD